LSNIVVRIDPLMRLTFSQAETIFVATSESKQLIPPKYHAKTHVRQAIGLDPSITTHRNFETQDARPFRMLFVGRLRGWKGIHLALKAFAMALNKGMRATLTIVGDGPQRSWFRSLAEKLGISDSIEWIPWKPHSEVLDMYANYDLFVFPSLHDSGGMVVLEAMANSLPVLCLDLGGPGTVVNERCGRVVAARGADEGEVVSNLAEAMTQLASTPHLLNKLRIVARDEAARYSWRQVVGDAYVQIISNDHTQSTITA
jgi:glycosyltransferase involved in cell wall biosynthesis